MFLLLKVLCVLERLEVWLLAYNTADIKFSIHVLEMWT